MRNGFKLIVKSQSRTCSLTPEMSRNYDLVFAAYIKCYSCLFNHILTTESWPLTWADVAGETAYSWLTLFRLKKKKKERNFLWFVFVDKWLFVLLKQDDELILSCWTYCVLLLASTPAVVLFCFLKGFGQLKWFEIVFYSPTYSKHPMLLVLSSLLCQLVQINSTLWSERLHLSVFFFFR